MGMNMIAYQIVNEFKKIREVISITLAGSGASGRNDIFSDIDIDIIVSKDISIERRQEIIKIFSDIMEVKNTFWGEGDEFILRNSNTQVDIAYFNIDWLKDEMEKILVKYNASTGYSTCFWHNIKNSIIVYDKDDTFKNIQKKYNVKYPEELKRNIINKNYPILKRCFSAYYKQIEKAINRRDIVSVNHRITAFFASYFDIIFAVNEMPHPGEKRLVSIIEKNCVKKPVNFSVDVDNLMMCSHNLDKSVLENILSLVSNLEELLVSEGLIQDELKISSN